MEKSNKNKARYDVGALVEGIQAADRRSLGQAITCIESRLLSDQLVAEELLERLLAAGSSRGLSRRIGITGVPGVGKSTFIETFGFLLLETKPEARLAVLTVDPTSQRSRGSILADKTRMEALSRHSRAYIRPSPSALMLGGMAPATYEAVLLCEAAGFDYIFIESVGVGQNELAVQQVVDAVVVLMLPVAGDAWQGVKRGILEIADFLLVNKADGTLQEAAKQAEELYRQSMQLMAPRVPGWRVPAHSISSLDKETLLFLVDELENFFIKITDDAYLGKNRCKQRQALLEQHVCMVHLEAIRSRADYQQALDALLAGTALPRRLARQLLSSPKSKTL